MKGLFFVCLLVWSNLTELQAQPKRSGAIQFESTFDPARMAAASGIKLSEEALARMPGSAVTHFELLFNLNNASYTPVEDMEDYNGSNGSGMRFGGGFGGGSREYYYSFADHRMTVVLDVNDTTFFLTGKLGEQMQRGFPGGDAASTRYIPSDQTKTILGFVCHKVTVKTTMKRRIMDQEKEIVDESNIWYTDELGFDFSPNPSLWTAGAVLAIEGKGTHIYAKSIAFRNVNAKDLSLPKKAVAITPEELRQKMELRRRLRGNRTGNNPLRSITIK